MSNKFPLDLVPMGKLLKPIGLNGKIKVDIFNRIDSSLEIGKRVWFKSGQDNFFFRKIESINISQNRSSIKFFQCDSRDDMDKILGSLFYLSRKDFLNKKETEHYFIDIIGSKVVDENYVYIGDVIDVLQMPAQNVILVEYRDREIFIPYVDAYVKLFDEKKNILIVSNVEDLRL